MAKLRWTSRKRELYFRSDPLHRDRMVSRGSALVLPIEVTKVNGGARRRACRCMDFRPSDIPQTWG
jgi:hypothetical protein